jgi:hypothetical protein
MKAMMLSDRLAVITFAGGLALAILLSSAGIAAAGDTRGSVRVGSKARSVHHPFFVHRRFVRSHFVSPTVSSSVGFDTVTPIPSIQLVIVRDSPPVVIQQDPPLSPPQPSYYWYSCGPHGEIASLREHAQGYCLGGLGPSVIVPPGPGKSLEQFQADDAVCRRWASAQAATMAGAASPQSTTSSTPAGSVQERYDIAYQQCMYAKENQIPGATRSAQAGNGIPSPPSP